MCPINILIVEDEEAISRLMFSALSKAGYHCRIAATGEECTAEIETMKFDLVLLDVMLPGHSGFELISYIREYHTPVIFITACADVKDRVKGLKLGAEDYIVKPFAIEELLARIEVVLRREGKLDETITYCGITLNTASHEVTKNGMSAELTAKEFELLLLFFKNPGIALYRETIYERVWREEYMGGTRTVELHVQRLRKKLGLEKAIETLFRIGYRFNPEEK